LVGQAAAPDALETAGDTISNVVAIGGEVSFAFNAPGIGSLFYATNGATTNIEPTTLPQTGLPSTGANVGSAFGSKFIYATSTGVYSTDGTSAGTTLLQAPGADFVPQPGTQMVTLPNGKVLFFALVNPSLDPLGAVIGGIQIWETDGTVAGTTLVGQAAAPDALATPGDTISNVVAIGGEVSFAFNMPGSASLLYATNGATTNFEPTTLPQTGLPSTGANVGSAFGSKFIYATSTGVYSTDGTSAGTTLLQAPGADFVPQPTTQMVTLPNGKVLFFALVNPSLDLVGALTGGIQIWETDGTAAGTTLVGQAAAPDGLATPGDTISNVVAIGGEVSFAFNVPGSGSLLYATNGTTTNFEPTTLPQTGLPITAGALTLCFLAGTRIATPQGEVAVEDLREGDTVVTVFGGTAPVVWLGHRRTDCTCHPRPLQVWPIRVGVDAFGHGRPRRELFLSPNHAVYVLDVLIPIKHLVNGTSIARVAMDEVTYWHVELPRHDLVLAEGLPAESYLDTGDRANFANGREPMRLFPDFSTRAFSAAAVWEANGCAPLIVYGPELAAARALVNAQAAAVAAVGAAA
jgi:hypothetical protein